MLAMGVDVLIVGAGPTGLLLAAHLARRGVTPRLIDRLERPAPTSRALGISAHSLELFDQMNIADELLARGRRLREVSAHSHESRVAAVSLSDVDSLHPYILCLPQNETEAILSDHVERLGVAIERGTTFLGLKLDERDNAVEVMWRGPDGEEHRDRYAWVVGCDGAHSSVREAAGVPFDAKELPARFALCDAKVECDLPPIGPHAFFDRDGSCLAVPLPTDGWWRLIVDVREHEIDDATQDDDGSEAEPSAEAIMKVFAQRSGRALRVMESGWSSAFTVHQRLVEQFRSGRVLLAGDAAHSHSPIGGQGMNAGLHDAANLGWKLAMDQSRNGASTTTLIDTYEAERLPIARALVRATEWATRIVSFRAPLAQGMRDSIIRFLASFEAVQQRAMNDLSGVSLHYRKSPLSRETHTSVLRTTRFDDPGREDPSVSEWFDFQRGPQPGDRAPICRFERPDGGRVHVIDLLRFPWFTLLLFDGMAATAEGYRNLAEIAKRIEQTRADLINMHIVVPKHKPPGALGWKKSILLDPDARAHARYGAQAESLYLIRPDGHIAFRAQPAESGPLEEYLRDVLAV